MFISHLRLMPTGFLMFSNCGEMMNRQSESRWCHHETFIKNIISAQQIKQMKKTKMDLTSVEIAKSKESQIIPKKIIIINNQPLREQSVKSTTLRSFQLSRLQQKILLLYINQPIYEIIDRNETVRCNYPLFHVMSSLVLKAIHNILGQSNRTQAFINFSLKKIQNNQLKQQLKPNHFNSFMVLMHKKQVTNQQLYSFMRQMLRQERQLMIGTFPYYFNLFALVVNKEIMFCGTDQKEWIQYSFPFEKTQHKESFSAQQVREQFSKLQKKCIEIYHDE